MKRSTSRRRLWLSAVLVMVPVAVLCASQWFLLRRLRDLSEGEPRKRAESLALEIREGVAAYYDEHVGIALPVSPSSLYDDAAMAGHFERTAFAGAREMFVVRIDGDNRLRVRFFDSRAHALVERPHDAAMQAIQFAIYPWSSAERRGALRRPNPQLPGDLSRISLDVFAADRRNRVALHPVGDLPQFFGATGIIIDESFVCQTLIPQIAGQARGVRDSGRDNFVVVMRNAVNGSVLYGLPPPHRVPLGHARLPFGMPDLFVEIYSEGPTPIQIASRSYTLNAVLLIVIALNALAGVAFTIRAAARQARFAEMTSEFVANVTHELRTPLASIRLFARLIRTSSPESFDESRAYGLHIEEESERLGRMIERILDLSRMKRRTSGPTPAAIDLAEILRSALRIQAPLILSDGVTVTLQVPSGPVLVNGDRDALIDVVSNLLENAIHYSPPHRKEIELALSATENAAEVRVRDHGIGIAPRDLTRVFNRFYRADDGMVRAVRGVGLGLSIVESAVEALGGSLTVESKVGHGSVFAVKLPRLAHGAVPSTTIRDMEEP